MSFVDWVFGQGLCVGGRWRCWSFLALGGGGGWCRSDYVGEVLLHEAVGSVNAHVVGSGHAVLCFMCGLPMELNRLWMVEKYIAGEESEGYALIRL